jgi:hypothetical protein
MGGDGEGRHAPYGRHEYLVRFVPDFREGVIDRRDLN